MSPPFRFAINSFLSRPKRSALLLAAIALSVALIVTVSCALASVYAAVTRTADVTVGRADVRITHAFNSYVEAELYDLARTWPGAAIVVSREPFPLPLLNQRTGRRATPRAIGVRLDVEYEVRPLDLRDGRVPRAPGEMVIDPMVADELDARLGDTLLLQRLGESMSFTVVGIVERPRFPILQRKEVQIAQETIEWLHGREPRYSGIDILLEPGLDPQAFVATHEDELPQSLTLQTTERVTSNLKANLASTQVSFLLVGILTFMSAAFIILTGMTVNVAERTRELAVLRAIGASRPQLALTQMYGGLLFGAVGTLLGVPLGLGLGYLIYLGYTEFLTAGFHVHERGLLFACLGSIVSGLAGAVYPAYVAATISPLAGLKVRASAPRPRGVVLCGVFGALLIVLQFVLLYAPAELQTSFWLYATFALPAMYLGYFLAAVPVAWLVASLGGPLLARLLRLPPGMLARMEHAAPYRFGLTAGAQMVGLSIMITVWSSGMSLFRDWIDAVRFPDAIAHAWFGIPEEKYDLLKSLEFVEETCATSIFPVDTREEHLFGVSRLQKFRVNFISFEPDEFFEMTAIDWLAGDPQRARRRLEEGGGVLIAREFTVATGLGVGDTIELGHKGQWAEFEIVGVVMSPGLNLATRLFGIGEAYLEQAISSVFGSRADAIRHFDNDDINLIQINLADDANQDLALARIESELDVRGLTTGSGKQLRAMIDQLGGGALAIGTVIAFTGLLVASFGVGNIIMANLQARRYEHGVLIAVGAKRGMLARAVLAEALIIAIVACLLGTAVGLQAANAANVLYGMYGLVLHLSVPIGPILFAWSALLLCTLIFVIPPIRRLRRTSPRELLSGSE